MPLYLNLIKPYPHHPWAQSLDSLVTPCGVGGNPESRNDHPLEATLTPSPVSSTTESLPFTLASGLIEKTPTDLPDSRRAGVDSQSSGSEHEQALPQEDRVEEHLATRLDPAVNRTHLSPLGLVRQKPPAITTDRMRSLDILDSSSDRVQRQSFVPQYSPLTAPSSSIHHLSPVKSTDTPVPNRPVNHPNHVFHKSRGASKLSRPIQPIDGPPPPVLQKAKGPWHDEEDAALLYWVSHLGTGKWVDIARRVGSRTVDHSAFRHEEDLMIITLQKNLQANKWCEVAKYLPGRPENAIKNRWNSRDLQRKREEIEAMREQEERQANAASACAPFGFMLPNPEVNQVFGQGQCPYGTSPKRVCSSPPANMFEFQNRLGLPYQTTRTAGNGTKKHRVIIEPHSLSQRDPPGVFSSANKLGFSNSQGEALLPYHNVARLHGAEIPNLAQASQANLGQEWIGYQTTPPPSASSCSTSRVQCLPRNQETGSGWGHYYSTPAQSPTYQVEASSTNSLLSSESSDPRHPPRYHSTPYDELATPKSSGSLIKPAYTQPIFMGPTPQPDVQHDMYYNCYLPETNDRRTLGMDIESPEKCRYDAILTGPGVGSGYPTVIQSELDDGYPSLVQTNLDDLNRDGAPSEPSQLHYVDNNHPNQTFLPTRPSYLTEGLANGKKRLDDFQNASKQMDTSDSPSSRDLIPLEHSFGTNSSHEPSREHDEDAHGKKGWPDGSIFNLSPVNNHHLETGSRTY